MARFVFSTILLSFLFLGLMRVLIELGSLVFTGHFFQAERIIEREGQFVRETTGGGSALLLLFPVLLGYGWMFWVFGNLLDVAWRVICRLFQPLAWLRGKASLLVYGPSPRKLATILQGQPILLLTSHNDEADLLLQIGSTPERLYLEYVEASFSSLQRLLEFAFLRPLVLGVFLKAVEMFMEVFSLGFSVWRALVQDFEVASPSGQPYYPAHLLVQERLNVRPEARVAVARVGEDAGHDDRVERSGDRSRGLRLSLQEVTDELKRQIQLRHSAYYEDKEVIARVSEFLTGAEVRGTATTRPSAIRPSPEFWEGLLIANVGLVVLYLWMAGPLPIHPAMLAMSILLAGYVLPFACLGIGLVFNLAARRRMPARLWRWFWVLWAIFGLFVLVSAVGLRLGPR
jgi:hypothetical protein